MSIESAKEARKEAQRLGVEVVERHVASIEELKATLGALSVEEIDAIFEVPDPMVVNEAQLIIDAKGTAAAVPFDVTDLDAVLAGVAAAEAALGPVDILVNNAGIPVGTEAKLFRDLDPEQWKPQIDLNTYAVMNCAKAVVDGMCERGYGRIVTISSLAATEGVMGVSAYSAGKGGGIGPARKIAAIAEASGLSCTLGSNLELGVASAAMIHVAMATPGITAEEFPCDILTPFFYEADLLAEPLPITAGQARPFDRPGLGVALDDAQVEHYRVPLI